MSVNGAGQYGWGFHKAYSGGTASATSLDYSTASYRPYLEVDFSEPAAIPEPFALTIWGLFLGTAVVGYRWPRRKS